MKSNTLRGEVELVEVTNIVEALAMRYIRNTVRLYMTHNTNKISITHQAKWFFKEYLPAKKRWEMRGFLIYKGDDIAGYGLITTRKGKKWVSGGLLPEYRRMGIGEHLFAGLTQYALAMGGGEVWLDVLKSNTRAQKLYKKLGYKRKNTTKKGDIIEMYYTEEGVG